jgi:hypothetical protein
MASLSRPQSSAAVRSPPSGYPSSSLKYTNGSHYSHPQNQLHADPTAVFASESRKFLSSRKGERSYPSSVEIDRDSGRHRSGSYSASSVSNGNGAASPETYHYHRGLPPPIPDRMHPSGRSQQQQLGQFRSPPPQGDLLCDHLKTHPPPHSVILMIKYLLTGINLLTFLPLYSRRNGPFSNSRTSTPSHARRRKGNLSLSHAPFLPNPNTFRTLHHGAIQLVRRSLCITPPLSFPYPLTPSFLQRLHHLCKLSRFTPTFTTTIPYSPSP